MTPQEIGPDEAAEIRLHEFLADVVDSRYRDLRDSLPGTPARAYRYFEYAEAVRGVIVGMAHGLFPVRPPGWGRDFATRITDMSYEYRFQDDVAGLVGVGREPLAQIETALLLAAQTRKEVDRLPVEHLARVQAMLYLTFVHVRDDAVRDLMTLALFGSEAQWQRVVENVVNATRQETSDLKLRALAMLPPWAVDGLYRWRAQLRFFATNMLDLPLDAEEPAVVGAVVDSYFSGGDMRARNALELMFTKAAPERRLSRVVLELALACLTRHSYQELQPLDDEDIAEEVRAAARPSADTGGPWPRPDFILHGNPLVDLVEGATWRLLPPEGSIAKARLDALANVLSPVGGAGLDPFPEGPSGAPTRVIFASEAGGQEGGTSIST